MSKTMTANNSTTASRQQPWLLLLGLSQFLLLGALGCRTTADNQIDLLERELRVQENYIYELEDYVVEYSEKLRGCRGCSPPQTAVYAEELYVPEHEPTPKRRKHSKKSSRRQADEEKSILEPVDEPEIEIEEDLPASSSDEPPADVSPEDIDVPESLDIEFGDPVGDLDDAPPLRQVATDGMEYDSTDDDVFYIPDPVDFEPAVTVKEATGNEQFAKEIFADEEFETAAAVVERVAERLEVAQLFRSEGDGPSQGNRSPQNLLVVVEALDANDEPVDLTGEVSLMVMMADGDVHDRLKRWDFTAAETVAAWQSSDLGDGLHLELPLEKIELPEAPLELWVRLVTTDGRKLLTQLPFETSQLSDIAANQQQSLPSGLVRIEESEAESVNSLRVGAKHTTKSDKLELAASQQATNREHLDHQSDDQPRWRSSMRRTDQTAGNFATTANKTTGWITQAPGRRPNEQARVASSTVSRVQQEQPTATAKPVWTSGRAVQTR